MSSLIATWIVIGGEDVEDETSLVKGHSLAIRQPIKTLRPAPAKEILFFWSAPGSKKLQANLEGVDDRLLVFLDRIVRELGGGQQAQRFERQVAQVGLAVRQKLAQLVAAAHQQRRVAAP